MAFALALLPFGLPAIGYGLTYIKDRTCSIQMLPGNVKKVTRVIETNKVARIFAGIFSLGLTEILNHSQISEEFYFEDCFIGASEADAAKGLNEKGNEFYKKEDYETAAVWFARASELAPSNEEYKGNVNRARQKIKEETARRAQEQAEKIKREEALRLERTKAQSNLLEEAINTYEQAEALNSLELKFEKYETALSKCEESCAYDATESAFNTLNKIFQSCLKHGANDEADVAVQIVRKYFPSELGCLQEYLIKQQNKLWCPDYESRARKLQEEQEQNRTVLLIHA